MCLLTSQANLKFSGHNFQRVWEKCEWGKLKVPCHCQFYITPRYMLYYEYTFCVTQVYALLCVTQVYALLCVKDALLKRTFQCNTIQKTLATDNLCILKNINSLHVQITTLNKTFGPISWVFISVCSNLNTLRMWFTSTTWMHKNNHFGLQPVTCTRLWGSIVSPKIICRVQNSLMKRFSSERKLLILLLCL